MKIIEQSYQIVNMDPPAEILKRIEAAGRTCYRSEDKITPDSARAFVARIVRSGHHSVLEHESISVRFITDRGVTHELVRHRLASYSQESTRYCDYGGGEIEFIRPVEFTVPLRVWTLPAILNAKDTLPKQECIWLFTLMEAAQGYAAMRQAGAPPQLARSVLPNALKTEIVCTMNLREWRYMLALRTGPGAHPQIRALMLPLLAELAAALPEVFGDA